MANEPRESHGGAWRRWLRVSWWSVLFLWLALGLGLWSTSAVASGPWFWTARGDLFALSTAFGCVQLLHASEGNDGPVTLLRYDGPVDRVIALGTANQNHGQTYPNPCFVWRVRRFRSGHSLRNPTAQGGIAYSVTEYQLPHALNTGIPLALIGVSWGHRQHAARVRKKRLQGGLCPRCGYDLRGSADAGRCPECGRTMDETQRKRATLKTTL